MHVIVQKTACMLHWQSTLHTCISSFSRVVSPGVKAYSSNQKRRGNEEFPCSSQWYLLTMDLARSRCHQVLLLYPLCLRRCDQKRLKQQQKCLCSKLHARTCLTPREYGDDCRSSGMTLWIYTVCDACCKLLCPTRRVSRPKRVACTCG